MSRSLEIMPWPRAGATRTFPYRVDSNRLMPPWRRANNLGWLGLLVLILERVLRGSVSTLQRVFKTSSSLKAAPNEFPNTLLVGIAALGLAATASGAGQPASVVQAQTGVWRREHRLIDLHQHVGSREDYLRRDVKIMDAAGLGVAVNLSGDTVTHAPGKPSAFEENKALADRLFPGRFVLYMNLDYGDWDEPDFASRAVRQVEEGHRLGAAGLKEYKRLAWISHQYYSLVLKR